MFCQEDVLSGPPLSFFQDVLLFAPSCPFLLLFVHFCSSLFLFAHFDPVHSFLLIFGHYCNSLLFWHYWALFEQYWAPLERYLGNTLAILGQYLGNTWAKNVLAPIILQVPTVCLGAKVLRFNLAEKSIGKDLQLEVFRKF